MAKLVESVVLLVRHAKTLHKAIHQGVGFWLERVSCLNKVPVFSCFAYADSLVQYWPNELNSFVIDRSVVWSIITQFGSIHLQPFSTGSERLVLGNISSADILKTHSAIMTLLRFLSTKNYQSHYSCLINLTKLKVNYMWPFTFSIAGENWLKLYPVAV